VTTPHAPVYIRARSAALSVPIRRATPMRACDRQQQVDVGNISAPPSVSPALVELVNQAHEHGIDLKIVVLDHNPPNDTPLRDIATVVGSQHPDATVLVLSPNFVGTYSTNFRAPPWRSAKTTPKPETRWVSAQNFLHQLEDAPSFRGPDAPSLW